MRLPLNVADLLEEQCVFVLSEQDYFLDYAGVSCIKLHKVDAGGKLPTELVRTVPNDTVGLLDSWIVVLFDQPSADVVDVQG